jgi:hypothetical protein
LMTISGTTTAAITRRAIIKRAFFFIFGDLLLP